LCKIRAKIGVKKGGFWYFYLQRYEKIRTFAVSIRMMEMARRATKNLFQACKNFLPAQGAKWKSGNRQA